MADWLRRAGRGRTADGTTITWSMAEGRRGRRWREVRTAGEGSPDHGVVGSLLLELDPDERFAHTEYATAAGLSTLHPEGDGTLHGNRITVDGVGHVAALAWDADDVLLVEGSAIASVAALRRIRGRQPQPAILAGVLIRTDLTLERIPIDVDDDPGLGWRLAGLEPAVRVDPDGLPVLVEGRIWPLEEAR